MENLIAIKTQRIPLAWISLFRILCGVLFLTTWYSNLSKGFYTPDGLYDFFMNEYPPMRSTAEHINNIKSSNLKLIAHFNLPEFSWLDNFYVPLEDRINILRNKYQADNETLGKLDMFKIEIDMYKKYSEYYGYTFFVMRKE